MNELLAHLFTKLILNVSLYAAQHEWLQDHVQPPKLMFTQLTAFAIRRCILDVFGKPLVEFIVRVKQTRHDEMQ